jgi:hypothetical protein
VTIEERFVEIRREAEEAERTERLESFMPPHVFGWRLDKSVSVGNIVTVMMMAGSAFFWGSNVEKRLAVHDETLQALKTAQEHIEANAITTRVEIRGDLLEINRKLDRVIERTVPVNNKDGR